MRNMEPLRGLNLALEGNPSGPKGSLQTTLRFPTPPRGNGGLVGRRSHFDPGGDAYRKVLMMKDALDTALKKLRLTQSFILSIRASLRMLILDSSRRFRRC